MYLGYCTINVKKMITLWKYSVGKDSKQNRRLVELLKKKQEDWIKDFREDVERES